MIKKQIILVLFFSLLFFLVIPKNVFAKDCEAESYEDNEGNCGGDDEDEGCKDIYTKSTAYVGDECPSDWICIFSCTPWSHCESNSGTDNCANRKELNEAYIDCFCCDGVSFDLIRCPRGYECDNGACKTCADNDRDGFCDGFEDRCLGTTGSCSGCNPPSCSVCKEPECPEYPDTSQPYCKNSASTRQCGSDYYEYGCFWGTTLGSDIGRRYHDFHCNGAGSCLDYPASSWSVVEDCDSNKYCYCTGTTQNDCRCKPICLDNDNDGYSPSGGNCGQIDCNDNNANIRPGATELCNNIDDDCDNFIDESLTQSQSCGSGACQGTQSRTCTSGIWSSWSTCSTEGISCGIKDCDNLDTECKDYSDKTKYCSNGICQEPSCTQYVNKPSTTQCGTDYYEYGCPWGNDLDDDTGKRLHDYHCDGQGACLDYPLGWIVDEYCTNYERCYWDGLGQGDNNYFCKGCIDNDHDNYYAYDAVNCPNGNDCNDNDNTIYPNALELCDNKDNNCNQQIDENLVKKCPKQHGVCQGTTQTCANGQWGNCNYGQYYQETETNCDNRDNDCDGQVDESSVICPSGQTCSNGVCIPPNATAIRTFSKYNVQTNEVITVYYDGSENIWSLKEKLPSGWSWISSVVLSPDGYLRDLITSATKFYQIKASANEGTYDFNLGEYCIGTGCTWKFFPLDQIKVGCNTPADTNCDGCVDDNEFPVAVTNWKLQQGGITDEIFPQIVTKWKNQEGC